MNRSPAEILAQARTIAVVGASPRPWRPSHFVMAYLLEQGYRALPVRPRDCEEVLGVPVASSLREIDESIDVVDVFRRAEFTPEIAREAVAIGARALWLQTGIVSAEASHRVARADAVEQPPRHGREQLVALVVSEAVVDRLEAVQIQQEDRRSAAGARGASERVIHAVAEDGTVRQPGE